MTVSSIVPVNNYTGNGSSTTFDFDFLIENESELVVIYKNKNAGNETVLTLGIDYSINETGNKNGSYITFPLQTSSYGVLSTEEMITLSLSLPVKQEGEFENSSNLNLSVLEWTFDYIVRILQILTRKVERCVKVQEGDSTTSDELVNNLYAAKNDAQIAAQTAVLEAQKAANSALESKNASLVLNTKANVDMDNITTAGMNKIKEILDVTSGLSVGTVYPVVCGKEYVPDGCLPCDGAEYTKAQFSDLWNNYLTAVDSESDTLLNTCTYSEYASDITAYGQCGKFAVKPLAFDSSKITIVGTPTIADDGVVSDFSTSNYLKTNLIALKNNWIIKIKVNFTNITDMLSPLLYYSNYNRIILGANGTITIFVSEDNVTAKSLNFSDVIFETNKNYLLTISFDGVSEYKLVAENLDDKTTVESVKQLASKFPNDSINWFIASDTTRYIRGSIDLKQFSITIDGKEVYNCVSGNTFKVPTIKNGAFIQQALSDNELGKSYNAGLPNITGTATGDRMANITEMTGAFSITGTSTVKNFSNGNDGTKLNGFDFDASRSSTVYGNSTTVQPNAVALRYFVVVANGQINQSQMDWSKWASSLQAKANKSDVDGQWVSSPHLLSEATAVGTYTVDLSSYLPSDNYTYEVIFNLKSYSTATCYAYIYTNDFPLAEISAKTSMVDIGSNGRNQSNTIILPITQKQVIMQITTANISQNCLSMIAYRRIGTNT